MENGLSCTTPYLSHVASPVSIFDFLICLLRVNIAMNRVDTFVICWFGPVGFNTFLTCTNICQNVFCCLNCTATVSTYCGCFRLTDDFRSKWRTNAEDFHDSKSRLDLFRDRRRNSSTSDCTMFFLGSQFSHHALFVF